MSAVVASLTYPPSPAPTRPRTWRRAISFRALWFAGLLAVAVALALTRARADDPAWRPGRVSLKDGREIVGFIEERGRVVIVKMPQLGEVSFARERIVAIKYDGAPPSPAGPAASPSRPQFPPPRPPPTTSAPHDVWRCARVTVRDGPTLEGVALVHGNWVRVRVVRDGREEEGDLFRWKDVRVAWLY